MRRSADDDVAPRRPVPADEVIAEAGRIEPSCGVMGIIIRIASYVRPRTGLRSGKLQAGGGIERVAALNGDDAVGLPTAQQHIHNRWSGTAKGSAVPIGHIVRIARYEPIPRIEGGKAAFQVEVRHIYGGAIPERRIVDRLGSRVTNQETQSVRKPLLRTQPAARCSSRTPPQTAH